jgi:tetratricopeptide (TPR) repeat protein
VPLLLWCPDLVSAGRDDTPARHVDIVPTILDALGEPPGPELPGQSLLRAGREEAPGGTYFEALSAALNRGWAPLRGLLKGGQKFIDLPVPELYDLRLDPAESKNLVSERKDSVRKLRPALLALPAGPLERGTIGSEEAAKLRSLGYLAGEAEQKASYGPEDDPKNLTAVDRQLHEVFDLFQRGRLDEALALSRKVVAGNPRMKMGYLQLTFLLQEKGNLTGALRAFEAADANGAGGESMDRRRGMLLAEQGRSQEAVKALERFRDTDDPDTLNALGIALTDSGRPADGLAVFARALEIDPRSAQAHQDSAIALLKLGRLEDARKSLETALAISPRNARALNTLGVVYSRLGLPEKALDAWSRCVDLNPKEYDALYNLGRVAGQIGDWALARQALERFAATAPPDRYGRDIAEVRTVLADMSRGGE